MKSAQMFGKIFIYVIALIVMAMIFAYGYNAVKSILNKGEQVLFIQMKTNIQSAVEDVSSDLGRVDKKVLQIPGNYNEVYFIDLAYTGNKDITCLCCPLTQLCPPLVSCPLISGKYVNHNPIICDAWRDSKPDSESPNMFLVHGATIKSLYIGDIYIEDGYKKINAPRGQIILRLEGVSNGRVLLDEWT